MPVLREAAIKQINAQFNGPSQPHIDAAHARKREVAQAVKAGAPPPAEFASEAALRGLTPTAFADLIQSKAAALDGRELKRQEALFAVDRATTPQELDAVVTSSGNA